MRNSRKGAVVLVALLIVIGFAYSLAPVPPSGSGYLPSFGGFFHVSEVQESPDNVSYSVLFHNVNFTFLYWCWSIPSINGSPIPAEQTVFVFVQVTFFDNSSEIIEIGIESPGSCLIGINYYLRGVATDHSQSRAGIATASMEELHSSWVYIVSF